MTAAATVAKKTKPVIEPSIVSISDGEDDAISISDDEDDIISISDDEDDIISISDDEEETFSIPDDEEEIVSIPDEEGEMNPIPDDNEDISSAPDDEQEVAGIQHDQQEAVTISGADEEADTTADDESEASALVTTVGVKRKRRRWDSNPAKISRDLAKKHANRAMTQRAPDAHNADKDFVWPMGSQGKRKATRKQKADALRVRDAKEKAERRAVPAPIARMMPKEWRTILLSRTDRGLRLGDGTFGGVVMVSAETW